MEVEWHATTCRGGGERERERERQKREMKVISKTEVNSSTTGIIAHMVKVVRITQFNKNTQSSDMKTTS
jgi:hypothetical protein